MVYGVLGSSTSRTATCTCSARSPGITSRTRSTSTPTRRSSAPSSSRSARWRSAAAIGIVIERFAYRPVRHHSRLTSLITAIGVSLLLEYGGQVVFGATPRFFPQMIRSQTYSLGGVQITNQSLMIIVVAVDHDVRPRVHRPSHEDRQGDARGVVQPAGRAADGDQHRFRHRVYVRAGVGAGGGRPACSSRSRFRASIR